MENEVLFQSNLQDDYNERLEHLENLDVEFEKAGFYSHEQDFSKNLKQVDIQRQKTGVWTDLERNIDGVNEKNIGKLLDDEIFLSNLSKNLVTASGTDIPNTLKQKLKSVLKIMKQNVAKVEINRKIPLQDLENSAKYIFTMRMLSAPWLFYENFEKEKNNIELTIPMGTMPLMASNPITTLEKMGKMHVPFGESLDKELGKMDSHEAQDLIICAFKYPEYRKDEALQKSFLTMFLRMMMQSRGTWYPMGNILKKESYGEMWEDLIKIIKKSDLGDEFMAGTSLIGEEIKVFLEKHQKMKYSPEATKMMRHWKELDRQKKEKNKEPKKNNEPRKQKLKTTKKIINVIAPKEEKKILPVCVEKKGKNEFYLSNFSQAGVICWVKIAGKETTITKKNFGKNLNPTRGEINLQQWETDEKQKVEFGYSSNGAETFWLDEAFALDPKRQKKKKMVQPLVKEKEPEKQHDEPLYCENFQIEISDLLDAENVYFEGEGKEVEVIFSSTVLELLDVKEMPFDIGVCLEPFEILAKTDVHPYLQKKLKEIASDFFQDKNRIEQEQELIALEVAKDEALKQEQERIGAEFREWITNLRLSHDWEDIRNTARDFRITELAHIRENEKEKNPFTVLARYKNKEAKNILANKLDTLSKLFSIRVRPQNNTDGKVKFLVTLPLEPAITFNISSVEQAFHVEKTSEINEETWDEIQTTFPVLLNFLTHQANNGLTDWQQLCEKAKVSREEREVKEKNDLEAFLKRKKGRTDLLNADSRMNKGSAWCDEGNGNIVKDCNYEKAMDTGPVVVTRSNVRFMPKFSKKSFDIAREQLEYQIGEDRNPENATRAKYFVRRFQKTLNGCGTGMHPEIDDLTQSPIDILAVQKILFTKILPVFGFSDQKTDNCPQTSRDFLEMDPTEILQLCTNKGKTFMEYALNIFEKEQVGLVFASAYTVEPDVLRKKADQIRANRATKVD